MADKKDYKINVTRGKEENQNRQLYKAKDAILRKWLDVCSDICEHGDKKVYEECLVQAFNLCEFVMDNYIEDVFYANRKSDNLVRIPKKGENTDDNGVYKFIEQDVVIDFQKQIKYGFAGKTEILEKLGVQLPKGIKEVRQKRNNYAHGTETYKNATREELNNFETVQFYIDTLGQLLVGMKKLNKEKVKPTYEELKLQAGKTLGYQGKYAVLSLLKEDEKSRLFEGRDTNSQKNILIKEILPCPELFDIYSGSKKCLQKVMGNGIVRTEDVILKNKACYIVSERIEGTRLYDYLKLHNDDSKIKKDLLYQIKKIVNTMGKYPDVCSGFCESDFVVDTSGDVWLTSYQYGKMKVDGAEIVRRYEMILAVEPEVETVEPEVFEPEEEMVEIDECVSEEVVEAKSSVKEVIEVKHNVVEDVRETETQVVVPKVSENEVKVINRSANVVDYEIEVMGQECNPNNWYKFLYTLMACGSVLLALWGISTLFV